MTKNEIVLFTIQRQNHELYCGYFETYSSSMKATTDAKKAEDDSTLT